MGLKSGWIRYGDRLGYLAYPERAKAPVPGVIVLQEAWGVDGHIRDVTERFARAGYVALAPDLFAKEGERPPMLTEERVTEAVKFMNTMPPGAWGNPKLFDESLAKEAADVGARIKETFGTIMGGLRDLPRYLPDVLDATSYLRDTCELSKGAKVGAVGFCFGGGLAGFAAANDPNVAAAAVFYGSHVADDLVGKLHAPLLIQHGSLDQRLVEGLPAYEAKLKEAGKPYELHVYEGAPHAFFNDTRPSYTVAAARHALVRTLEFFEKNLSS